ncbi:hypothetical protein UFOVP961_20 [uncultured Caudovirales phage]|uniref:Uncharacterized protein n=1 Tax=uncultured Caudovirales phage TaxID=2100421 RepID=A0A6J5QLM1_9CAUD|nr:hypothetical protein UFOVP961_20 [uncultured Caudovirales phage]CAB4185530.1 hypothetical protein UFOVP1123_90 [uncultured Caudovirales phage]CAB4193322.1 hypothetical protein UFOVP1239_60 [uncultured Caudovirales phage]CAB4216146.1 hypothetical protein UFOVP1484_94 [uncultured Caudovirales phage]CAB5230773.1 hypothetical protein UFOVP1577_100 [uncultured Caudovirales phage]
MSYLFPQGSTTELGAVEVGANIDVLDGVISIPQSVASNASVTFDEVIATTSLKLAGKSAITTVTPTSGLGVSITALTSTGPASSFVVNNTGVLGLVAGTGIVVSASTGTITVSATGTTIIKAIGVTSNYVATADDEYIGVDSTSLVTITLPLGVTGRIYTIKEEHGNNTGKVNVQGTSNEKLDGSSFKQLSALASLTVVFRAGAWRII